MLQKAEKAVSYFLMIVVFILSLVFLIKQVSLSFDIKDRINEAKGAGVSDEYLQSAHNLHRSSTAVAGLSFFSFLIILIGLIVLINTIEKAYENSEVKQKVRIHLKESTPGIIMIVLGCFILAFCVYRTTSIEGNYLAYTGSLTNKIANQPSYQPMPVVTVENLKKDTMAAAAKKEKPKKPLAKKPEQPPKTEVAKTTPPSHESSLTQKQAQSYIRSVVLYGYVPQPSEVSAYEDFYRKNSSRIDPEFHWAYSFLRKTEKGYQPKPGELERYESFVERNLSVAQSNRP